MIGDRDELCTWGGDCMEPATVRHEYGSGRGWMPREFCDRCAAMDRQFCSDVDMPYSVHPVRPSLDSEAYIIGEAIGRAFEQLAWRPL